MKTTSQKKGFIPTPILALLRGFCSRLASKMIWGKKREDGAYSSEAAKTMPTLVSGFTLVEMIVSIGLFTIVLFIATSAFLTVVNADRKTRATRIAADNLSLALEDMERRVRTGSSYYCGIGGELGGVRGCSGETSISFTEQDGITRTTYKLEGNKITRQHICIVAPCVNSLVYDTPIDVTAPEVSITSGTGLKFIVQGSTPGVLPTGDSVQPYVTVVIDGSIGATANPAGQAKFKIQTTITQRNYDI